MRVQLQTPLRRIIFALVSLGLVFFYLVWEVRVFWADRLAVSMDVEQLRHASMIDSSNAKYYDLLARHLFYSEQDIPGALVNYRRAVTLDPRSARYWLGLAQVLQVMDDSQGQISAINHAIQADPRTPSIAWQAGNLFLIAGQPDAALGQFKTVLQEDIREIGIRPVLEMSWRAAQDVNKVETILPADPAVWLEFIEMLTEKKESAAAEKAWNDLTSRTPSFEAKQGLFYIEYLILQHNISKAYQAWDQLSEIDKKLQSYSVLGNLVVNGGFEQDLLNGGFDWRYASTPDVEISLETDDAHGGTRSLVLSFTASTVSDVGVYQLIPVKPNTAYRFSAYVKSEDISSANGPRLAVYDSSSHEVLWLSEEAQETSPWHELAGRFTTRQNTNLITLDIMRTSSTTHINGKFWLDDVSLVPE